MHYINGFKYNIVGNAGGYNKIATYIGFNNRDGEGEFTRHDFRLDDGTALYLHEYQINFGGNPISITPIYKKIDSVKPIIDLTISKMTTPGDFSFIKDKNTAEMFTDAYDSISKTEKWGYLSKYTPGDGGFMFSKPSEEIEMINSNLKYEGHSGSSYAWTMRIMEHIAKNGWGSYIDACKSGAIAGSYTEQIGRIMGGRP